MQFAVEAVAEQVETGFDLDEGQAVDLAKRIRSALQPDKEAGESEQLDAMLAGLKGRPEMLEVLSADKVGELATGVAGGANVYELMLYLEEFPALGEAIVAWLTAETTIISNRTVLTGGKSWFDFLILSSHSPATVREALLLRDPERECVKSLRQVGGEMLLSDETGTDEEAALAKSGARRTTEAAANSRSSTVLRVRSDIIDRFMTQIGEIRIAAAELAELTASGE